eukprot:snap_masked-scaffold_25-processed-gene-5.15-mRNA-1 protein AED:1.00 eAED:1.00 QI:0/0/0/0/1/1/3/0/70
MLQFKIVLINSTKHKALAALLGSISRLGKLTKLTGKFLDELLTSSNILALAMYLTQTSQEQAIFFLLFGC